MITKPLVPPKPFKVDITPLYRYKRTGAFIYVEGNENPINLRDLKPTGNPVLNNMILNQRVDELWYEHNPNKELTKIIIIVGIIVIIVVLVILFFFNKQTPVNSVLPG